MSSQQFSETNSVRYDGIIIMAWIRQNSMELEVVQ